jgi:hypothetical protein
LARRLNKDWHRQSCRGQFCETTMIFSNKLMLGGAALLIATAASFPQEIGDRYLGTYPQDIRKREALKVCQENSLEFVRFFASDREACFTRMRVVGAPGSYSGVWSKPDRSHMTVAQN